MLARKQDPAGRIAIDQSTFRQISGLCVFTVFVYLLFSYGGVRSPDSEVVFRTAEQLATKGTFGLTSELKGLEEFGLPPGTDGRFYSIFGPGQSIACVPLVKLALLIDKSGWYDHVREFIPVSHYVGDGIIEFVKGTTPADLKPHALRFLVSVFNIVVGSLSVAFFFLLVRLLTGSDFSARWTTILFAFGSLMMPYAGTFFSEPLATLLAILSLYCLVWNDMVDDVPSNRKYFCLLSSGIFLGLATTVHISAILFAPFFFVYAIYPILKTRSPLKNIAISGTAFSIGIAFFLALLGFYNQVRFGNFLETGRTASPHMIYATYVAPWRGLYGLVLGGGKGILWYCPAAVISFFIWRPFHKRNPVLSYTLLGSVIARLVFIACRSDWHGGYSLGPRYMVMALPLLILPYGQAIEDWKEKKTMKGLWLFFFLTLVCICEQIYFSIGEVFSFLHIVNWTFRDHGFNVFLNDALYLNWETSPLLYLLDTKRGPFLMKFIHVGNGSLFWLCASVAALLLFIEYQRSLIKYVNLKHRSFPKNST